MEDLSENGRLHLHFGHYPSVVMAAVTQVTMLLVSRC